MVNNQLIQEMEEYARINNVPIMNKEGINYLQEYCKNNKIKNILEIGTAIAYSTIILASTSQNVYVTSIERDEKRYLEAVKNVKESGVEDRITLIYGDALEIVVEGEYDLIFIDAAKAQNIKFFEKYKNNLASNGTIITDNMKFHGLVDEDEEKIESRNLRQLVRKIKKYKEYLETLEDYTTCLLDIGDGLAIITRK